MHESPSGQSGAPGSHCAYAPCTGFFLESDFNDFFQRIMGEFQFYSVKLEKPLKLFHNGIFRLCQNSEESRLIKLMEGR